MSLFGECPMTYFSLDLHFWMRQAGAEYNKKDYAFQSSGVLDTLQGLLKDFRAERSKAAWKIGWVKQWWWASPKPFCLDDSFFTKDEFCLKNNSPFFWPWTPKRFLSGNGKAPLGGYRRPSSQGFLRSQRERSSSAPRQFMQQEQTWIYSNLTTANDVCCWKIWNNTKTIQNKTHIHLLPEPAKKQNNL